MAELTFDAMTAAGAGGRRSSQRAHERSKEYSSTLVPAALGLASAGYLDLIYSQTLGLFLPGLVTIAFLLVGGRYIRGLSVGWLTLTGLLIVWLLVAACLGNHGGVRAIGFAIYMGLPLLGLAMVPRAAILPYTVTLATYATLGMVLWIAALLVIGQGELRPWGLWTPSASINTYGVLLNMLWPILLMHALESKLERTRWLYVALAVAGLLTAVATYSRLSIATAVILVAIIGLRRWPLRAAMTLAGVVLLSWLFADATLAMLTKLRLFGWEPQFGRMAIWSLALAQAEGHAWFGHAPGGAKHALATLSMYTAHNDVLNLYVETGLIGAILGGALLLALLVMAVRAILRSGAALFPGCAILAYCMSTIVAGSLARPELTLALGLIMAICRYTAATHLRVRA